MKTPKLNTVIKQIKNAKGDYKIIKRIVAEFGSNAQWDQSVGNECTEFSFLSNLSTK